jgi:hypothetical protein
MRLECFAILLRRGYGINIAAPAGRLNAGRVDRLGRIQAKTGQYMPAAGRDENGALEVFAAGSEK